MTFAVCFRPHGAVPRTSFCSTHHTGMRKTARAVPRTSFCRGQGHCVSLSIIYIYLYFSLRSYTASGTLRGCGPCLSPSQAGVPAVPVPPAWGSRPLFLTGGRASGGPAGHGCPAHARVSRTFPVSSPGCRPARRRPCPSVTGRPWGTPAPGACQEPCEGPHPGPSPNSAPREPGAWRARREQAGRGGRIPTVSCRPKAPLPARAGRGFARGGGEPPAGTWGKALLAAPSPGCHAASGAGPVPAPACPSRSGSQG